MAPCNLPRVLSVNLSGTATQTPEFSISGLPTRLHHVLNLCPVTVGINDLSSFLLPPHSVKYFIRLNCLEVLAIHQQTQESQIPTPQGAGQLL